MSRLTENIRTRSQISVRHASGWGRTVGRQNGGPSYTTVRPSTHPDSTLTRRNHDAQKARISSYGRGKLSVLAFVPNNLVRRVIEPAIDTTGSTQR
jgi:hypothetical protein